MTKKHYYNQRKANERAAAILRQVKGQISSQLDLIRQIKDFRKSVKEIDIKLSLFEIDRQNLGKLKETIRKHESTIQRLEGFISSNRLKSKQRQVLMKLQVFLQAPRRGKPEVERAAGRARIAGKYR